MLPAETGTIPSGWPSFLPAKLYAFDILQEAVDATRKRLCDAGFAEKMEDGSIELICDSHEHLTDHVKTFIQAAVFNLGYLPGADKSRTTAASSTMRAVRSCLSRLEPDGLVCITMYSGHPAGRQEKEHLLAFAENLDKRQWPLRLHQFDQSAGRAA